MSTVDYNTDYYSVLKIYSRVIERLQKGDSFDADDDRRMLIDLLEVVMAQLQESREFDFREIGDHLYDGIYITDGQGKTMYVNKAYTRITGISAREVVGRYVAELMVDGLYKNAVTPEVLRTKKQVNAMAESMRNGIKMLITGNPILDPDGNVKKVVVIDREMSDLLEMQNEELRRAHEEIEICCDRYKDIYNFAPVGYITVNESGKIVEANLTMAKLLDLSRKALIGQPLSQFILQEDQDSYMLHFRRVMKTGVAEAIELRMKKKNGSHFWVQIEEAMASNANDQSLCHAVVVDITERKQVEEALQESEARYRAVVEQAPEAIILCDPDTGKIVESNRRFSDKFGYDSDRAGTLNLFELIVDEPENIRSNLNRLMQQGGIEMQKRQFRHCNGSLVNVERAATMVNYRGRKLSVMTIRDVGGPTSGANPTVYPWI